MTNMHERPPLGSKCRAGCRRPTMAQAHCSVCHRTFGGVRGFDAHRKAGWCLDPVSLGFVERDRVWRKPMDEVERDRIASLRGAPRAVDGRT